MNVRELEVLKDDERELVMRAPSLICVLIGGADGEFDKKEIDQAITAVHFRSKQGEALLQEYYEAVDKEFEAVLMHVAQKYEGDEHDRAKKIIAALSELSSILPKLDRRFAKLLLEDWKSLAKSVANATGGFLGYAKISVEESHYTELEMIEFEG